MTNSKLNDKQLIAGAQVNHAYYGTVYERYSKRVYHFFLPRVGYDRELARDLVQETFLRAFRHLDRYQERGYSYWTYLVTIARNVLINYYRLPKPVSLALLPEVASEEEGTRERQELAEAVWRAVADLPAIEKQVFVLRYRDDLAQKEIAKRIGKSENAVKLILLRARRRLAANPEIADLQNAS